MTGLAVGIVKELEKLEDPAPIQEATQIAGHVSTTTCALVTTKSDTVSIKPSKSLT